MSISGPLPFHVARAYGIPPTTRGLPRPGPDTPTAAPQPIAGSLVAGRVDGPLAYEGGRSPVAEGSPLQLYTRAADKVEAAVAVRLGRAIDVRG
jgi:hypothetical protein